MSVKGMMMGMIGLDANGVSIIDALMRADAPTEPTIRAPTKQRDANFLKKVIPEDLAIALPLIRVAIPMGAKMYLTVRARTRPNAT